MNPKKCHFFKSSVTYLGHTLTSNGVLPNEETVKSVREFPRPTNVKQVKGILGMCGFFRPFVKNFAEIAVPLTALTRKNTPFKWDDQCEVAFNKLKQVLTEPPLLAYPDFKKPFILMCDSSGLAAGGCLAQEIDGQIRPIAYYSKKYNDTQRRYSTYEQELFSLVLNVRHFRDFLLARPFFVLTDCQSLIFILKSKRNNARILRWVIDLLEFKFQPFHVSGKENIVADTLSRIECPALEKQEDLERALQEAIDKRGITKKEKKQKNHSISKIANTTVMKEEDELNLSEDFSKLLDAEKLREAQLTDPVLAPIIENLKRGRLTRKNRNNFDYFLDQDQLLKFYNPDSKRPTRAEANIKIVIPKSLIKEVLTGIHDRILRHVGVAKTLQRVKEHFIWGNMYSDVQNFVLSCEACAKAKFMPRHHKMPFIEQQRPTRPFEKVHLDLCGPYHVSPERKYRYIMTITDAYSRYTKIHPLTDATTKGVILGFQESWLRHCGCPKTIVTDCASIFTSDLFQKFCSHNRIKHIKTSPFTPQSNALSERTHSMLGRLLAINAQNLQNWDYSLPTIEYTLNNSVHRVLGDTPTFVAFAVDLPDPLTNSLEGEHTTPPSGEDYASRMQQIQRQAQELVRKNLEQAYTAQRQAREKCASKVTFKLGDLVYMFAPHLIKEGLNRKTKLKSTGPLRIVEQTSPVSFVVQDIANPNKRFRTHANKLTKVISRKEYLRERGLDEQIELEEEVDTAEKITTPLIYEETDEIEFPDPWAHAFRNELAPSGTTTSSVSTPRSESSPEPVSSRSGSSIEPGTPEGIPGGSSPESLETNESGQPQIPVWIHWDRLPAYQRQSLMDRMAQDIQNRGLSPESSDSDRTEVYNPQSRSHRTPYDLRSEENLKAPEKYMGNVSTPTSNAMTPEHTNNAQMHESENTTPKTIDETPVPAPESPEKEQDLFHKIFAATAPCVEDRGIFDSIADLLFKKYCNAVLNANQEVKIKFE